MDLSTDLFGMDIGLLAAPFVAGLLVLSTHVPFGMEVLRRGIIFIDLAIAQVAALGVIAAGLAGFDELGAGLVTQFAAGGAAVAGALLLTWTDRRWPGIQEALIGLLFVVAAAAGILLLARDPHGGDHLRDLLTGQILWANWHQLWPIAVAYGAILALWRGPAQRWPRVAFYLLFALVVTASVQLVGVLLVFASLIAPALGTQACRHQGYRLLWAYGLGVAAYAIGLLASLYADLPAGAAIVCALAMLGVSGLIVGKRHQQCGLAGGDAAN